MRIMSNEFFGPILKILINKKKEPWQLREVVLEIRQDDTNIEIGQYPQVMHGSLLGMCRGRWMYTWCLVPRFGKP